MRKYSLIMMAAAAMVAAAVSCSKEIEGQEPEAEVPGTEAEGLVHVSFSALLPVPEGEAALGAQSRAGLSGSKVVWSAGDELAVHDGTEVRKFTLEDGAGTVSGKFGGYVNAGATTLNALFPYSAGSWNGSGWDYAIPCDQDASVQSIDPAALIATATGTVSGGLTFSNAPALIRFSVGAGTTQVIFHTKNGEKIAGESKSLIVKLPGAGTYEAAINPGTYAGIMAFVTNGSGTFLKDGAASLTLASNQGKPLGEISSSTEVVAIATAAELKAFLSSAPALDAYLCRDINLSGETLSTCASYADDFYGLGHKLTNWESEGVALFGTLSGSIQDLTLDASCTLGDPAAGNFGYMVKELTGSMTGCVNEADINVTFADVTSQYIFGSLVGCSNSASSVMKDCENKGNIDIAFSVPASGDMNIQYMGGLVGKVATESDQATLRMDGCVNSAAHFAVAVASGAESAQETTFVGGIAGAAGLSAGVANTLESGYTHCFGKFNSCVNHSDVSVTYGGGLGRGFKVGGIAGSAECVIANCSNDGAVSMINSNTYTNNAPAVGGIAGVLCGPATVPNAENCTNSGTITLTGRYGNGTTAKAYSEGYGGHHYITAGGCFGSVGDNATLISNCDNYGFINFTPNGTDGNGSRLYMGGVVGRCVASIDGCENLYNGATPQEMSSQTIHYGYLGGVAGLCSNTSVSNCSNIANINFSRTNRSGQTVALADYVGGVVGIANAATSISGCSNSGALVYDHPTASTGGTRIAGIVGHTSVAVTVSSCSNTGSITYTGKEEFTDDCFIYIAGVLAYDTKALTISNCSNTADLSYNGGGVSTDNIWLGGVLGYAGASFTMTSCSNEGGLTASGWARTGNNYIGGVYGGGYGTVSTIRDCTNEGDINITSNSKLHLGGIAGALRGSFFGNVQNADINASGVAQSKVGGIVGFHYAGPIQKSTARRTSVTGSITTNLTATSFTGGVSGGSLASSSVTGLNNVWSDFDVNATVVTSPAASTKYIGALIGGIVNADAKLYAYTVTLDGTNTYGSTTVNGAAISSSNILGTSTGSISGFVAP